MRIPILAFGAFASIITTVALANTVVTSQTYVDNQDALKVDIAQGVGTNNANVGKTLVVNSSGNLELGTPAAGNYVEDSITDGVTNKAPSENAVHDALADKQDLITTSSVTIGDGGKLAVPLSSFVTSDGSGGVSGNTVGLLQSDSLNITWWDTPLHQNEDNAVPSVQAVRDMYTNVVGSINFKQHLIPVSGYSSEGNAYTNDNNGWLSALVKGTGLVTRTSTGGVVGERKIIETADVANYGTGTATERQIQEISIPTMGAVMAAISNNTPTLPTGTANTVVMYNNSGAIGGSRAIYDGSATYNATNDATKLVTANGVSKMKECTRWADNAEHTDANCLLWRLP